MAAGPSKFLRGTGFIDERRWTAPFGRDDPDLPTSVDREGNPLTIRRPGRAPDHVIMDHFLGACIGVEP